MAEPHAEPHPTPDQLRAYGGGELDGPEADAVRQHLDSCSVCRPLACGLTGSDAVEPGSTQPTGALKPGSGPSAGKLPARVGRYRLEQEIARGGMGQVVRVTDETFQRPLAMKIALGDPNQDTQERFIREALLTGQLQHPGLPAVQEMGRLDDGRPYFIMKLVKGSDLGTLLRQRPAFSANLPRWVAVFEQICQTLGYAHSHGIIHRDLKPGNVMVGAFGEVQVMDWGLAKLLTPGAVCGPATAAQPPVTAFTVVTPSGLPQETVAGTVLGTSAYMPPEQARGEAETLDRRCDVFGLGGILCEVLTGKPPFADKMSIENQRRSMKGDLSAAFGRLDASGVDAELIDLAKRCLAPERNDRPADAGVVAEAVARYQAALQERMKKAEIDRAAALVKAAEERKRRRVSLALAAAVVLLLVTGGAWALWYQGEIAGQLLRQEYLNKEVSAAVAVAEQRRQDLLEKLANQRQVNELLSDIGLWQNALREANAAWLRAEKLAAGSRESIEEPLAQRLRKLEDDLAADAADWKFGQASDDARLAAVALVDGKWDPMAAAKSYPRIFVGTVDVVHGDFARVVDQIKKSPIRLVYLAALDHWADFANDPELRARLFAVANAVDTDPWRKEFRNLESWQNEEKLQALADKVSLREQSPQLLLALAKRLPKTGGALLRNTMTDHPRDFWIFFQLGKISTDPVEQEGYYRAALAIRPGSSTAHNNLGNALLEREDVDGAMRHYRKAIAIDPNWRAAHANLGSALLARDEVEEAIKHCLRSLEIDPDFAIAHANLGNALLARKDVEGAIKQYRKALELDADPYLADIHVSLGNALLRKKDTDGAVRQFLKALEIDPKLARAYNNLGNAHRDRKEFEEAIKCYRTAIDLKPNYAGAYHNLGMVYRDKKDYEGAIGYYHKAIELKPKFVEPRNSLGDVQRERNDMDGAIKHYYKALEIKPDNALAYNSLGVAFYAKKDMDQAVKHYRKAIDIDPTMSSAHFNLGTVLLVMKDMDGAVKHLGKAIDADPDNAEAHVNLGRALFDRKDFDGAVKHAGRALEINPRLAKAHGNLGAALYYKKDLDGAVKHYHKALEIDPDLVEAHVNLGAVLQERKETERAMKHLLRALEIDPNNASAHLNLGFLLEKKDLDGAIGHYLKALEVDPNNPKIHHNLGTVYLEKKNADAAIKHLRRALEGDANNAATHSNLGNALRLRKDLAGAVQHHLRSIEIDPSNAAYHVNLGAALHGKKDVTGAVKEFLRALEIDPNLTEAHLNLRNVFFFDKQGMEQAVKHLRKAVELDPNNAETHFTLGGALFAGKDMEEAGKHFRKVLELNPNYADAHVNLGLIHIAKMNLDDAVKQFRKALEINPSLYSARTNLGCALYERKDLEEALVHLRKVVDVNPNDAALRVVLGHVLRDRMDWEGAVLQYRKAVEIDPALAEAHDNLGRVLFARDVPGAITHLRKALDLKPGDVLIRGNLGVAYGAHGEALSSKGQFDEARTAMLESLKLLTAEEPQRKLVQQNLQRCEKLLVLDQQLSAVLQGGEPPSEAADLWALADLCFQHKHFYAAAARFSARALKKDPALADEVRNNRRFFAACAAVLAAAGKGKDVDKLQDRDRILLRRQALDWLRADLAAWRKLSQSDNVQDVLLLTNTLPTWQDNVNLVSVRAAKELAELPREEREAWQKLWADLAQLLKEGKARFIETQHPGTLPAKQKEQVQELKVLAGKTYVVDLQSSQFDTHLRLEDAGGKVLAKHDDVSPQNKDRHSRLILSPNEAGVYRIVASSPSQRGTGAYVLTIREFVGGKQ